MGKETKITIKYEGLGDTANIGALLNSADESDLRVMVALSMLVHKNGHATQSELCELLGMDKPEVSGALKYWRGAGLADIASVDSTDKKKEKTEAKKADKKERARIDNAHRNGVLEQSAKTDAYSAGELADIMERRVVSPALIDEAQRIMGKIFRTYDTGILVGMVERLGFDEDAVLVILNYTVGKGKKTMRYAETLAMALYDEGICDTEAVIDRLERMERSGEIISKIKSLYGIGDRALTANEKKLFKTWTEIYGYDIDIIRIAYDITVDNTQKPVPKYTNGILERWYAERLRTEEDVKRYLEMKSGDGSAKGSKSYDADDFFEAALQRSYEDL